MEQRANEIRDAFARELASILETESARPAQQYAGGGPLAVNRERDPLHDWFQVGGDGRIHLPWGGESDVPADLRELASSKAVRRLLDPAAPVEPLAQGSSFFFFGDLAVRQVTDASGGRLLQGFRIDLERLEQRYLEPVSPHSVVPRFDERIEQVRLVRDDARLRTQARDAFGLPQYTYRHVVAPARPGASVLLPPGLVLSLEMHPAASLGRQLAAAEERLWWTLAAVAAVVVLGLLFAWRAVRAESRLATRKSEFISAVSHELRTPLTSIRMYADLLKEGWVEDERTAQEYFVLIAAESERLTRLVNNVLDFSRIEKGKKTFDMRVGDPAAVVRDVAGVLRPYLREKGFEFSLALPERLPECLFDKDALTQILVNLIDNAVKHGAGEVRVEGECEDGEIALRILDRGPGVPVEQRDRIFDPFHTSSPANGAGGSGLGLALVRHYLAAHRGRIEVRDRDGGGAVFVLRLPAAG
jgi:signal transduction histidine kinase